MLRLLATRRWLGFTALVIASILGFAWLSSWQFERAEDKRRDAETILEGSAAPPVEVDPGDEPPAWAAAELTGEFADAQLAVRQRPQDGANGWWVVTPLRTDAGTAWVVRGWLRADGPATTMPDLPAAPDGPVTVTGTWQAFEDVDASRQAGLPAGMLAGVGPTALPERGDYEGFLLADDPGPGLVPITADLPDDARNTSYAWQWILFAIVAITGWFVFLRREAREDGEAAAQAAAAQAAAAQAAAAQAAAAQAAAAQAAAAQERAEADGRA